MSAICSGVKTAFRQCAFMARVIMNERLPTVPVRAADVAV